MNKNITHTNQIIISYISQIWNIWIEQNDTFHWSYTMMKEYNTHTHSQIHTCAKHMDILLLTLLLASMSAPAARSKLTMSALPSMTACMRAVLSYWWKYYNWWKYYIRYYYQKYTLSYDTLMHNIIFSYIISKCTINQIKSSNIIKWLRVIQSERERERIMKRKATD